MSNMRPASGLAYGESDNLMWWRNASCKYLQVKILAELNGCSVDAMKEWLLAHGVTEEEMRRPRTKKCVHHVRKPKVG